MSLASPRPPVAAPHRGGSSSRRLLAALGAACVLIASFTGLAATTTAQATEGRIVLDSHHTDAMSVRYEDDTLLLRTRADLDDGSRQVLDPADVLFHVTDRQRDVIPDVPAFGFLGEPGSDIWKIEQSYSPGLLWAGWETESLPRGAFVGDSVRLNLQGITGPGRAEIYLNDLDGPRRVISSSDESLRTITASVGAHVHANWVFTEAGVYEFTFVAEAERVSGGALRSEPQTYTFLVGSGDAPAPSPSGSGAPTPAPSEPAPSAPAPSAPASPPPAPPAPAPTTPAPAPTPSAPTGGGIPDPSVAPDSALPAPDPESLVDGTRGEVEVSNPTVAPGAQVPVTVPAEHASHWVSPWLLSTPTDLGWKQVNGEGGFTVAVPEDAPEGAHRLVIRDRSAELIGWTDIEVVAADKAIEQCVATPVTTEVTPGAIDVADDGHFDFGPVKEGGVLRALVKDDRTATAEWKDPAGFVFHLGEAASTQAPGGQFDFLGTGEVWQMPLTQQPGVPWLGWNTQHPSIAGRADGPITLTLDGLEGPGDLAVYSVNSWGQLGARYFGTVDGFPRSTNIDVGASGVHVHGAWAFTEPGAYYATMTFSGTVDGEAVSGTSTLTFFVGPGDPASAARDEATSTTFVGRTESGAECQPELAETGSSNEALTTDLAGLAGALLLVGLAFFGASALAPRRPAAPTRTP